MLLREPAALLWTQRCLAFALLLQSLELLQIRRHCRDDGLWSWPLLATEHRALPALLRAPLAVLLPYRPFVALLLLRAAASAVWLATAELGWAAFLLLGQVAICVRFRGTFNGGSDSMSVLILLALTLALQPSLERAALSYIAVQLTLSYLIAGVVKLRQPEWRSGEALTRVVVEGHYAAPAWLRRLVSAPGRARLLARGLIGFECALPLAWLDPRVCAALLLLGLAFHAASALAFGLNRFLFAWAAGYPALLFCSQLAN